MLRNNSITYLISIALCLAGCHSPKPAQKTTNPPDVLSDILHTHQNTLGKVLSNPGEYHIQIIYTQINRDDNNEPQFSSYYYSEDSARYFYPASTVKMPLAFLAIERINQLQKTYPALQLTTPYRMDSMRYRQMPLREDISAANGLPSVAHDIKKIFLVSDNFSYNNLFDFLGREYINKTLWGKGYTRTGIMHRFYLGGIDNRYTRPVTFYEGASDILRLPERLDTVIYKNPQYHLQQGKGYINGDDQLVEKPFDFGEKNWMSLQDMHDMLKAVMFPASVPVHQRFDLTESDYRFLYSWMSAFPRESEYPAYDTTEYYDGYVKFFLYGDSKAQRPEQIRIFNKVGQAYGYLTDVAYIVDFQKNIEFMLAATIRCNEDGIYNDDQYSYDETGFPFLANLGRAVYEYEAKRKRKNMPDLGRYTKLR